jgi:hypothetical protein
LAPPQNIGATGGPGVVSVTAQPECPWTVSSQANWISNVSPSSGQGAGKVEFVAAANEVPSIREAEIVINDNRVRVMQEAAPCRFGIDPERRTMAAGAANASIAVSTHEACRWTARSNAEWITIASGAEGAGNGTVTIRVTANSGGVRTSTVTIGDRTHTIVQQETAPAPSPNPPSPNPPSPNPPSPNPPSPNPPSPPPPAPNPPTPPSCNYTIDRTSQTIGAAGGSGQVGVTTTAACSWTAVSNATAWLTVTSAGAGTGNGSVGFTAAPNTGAERSGALTIAGRTFTVTQSAAAPPPPPPPPPPPVCTYTLNPTSASLTPLGGTRSIAVSAPSGCAWTVANTAGWITIIEGAGGGTGNGSVEFFVLPNIVGARSSALVIAGQSFTVSQDAVLPSQP